VEDAVVPRQLPPVDAAVDAAPQHQYLNHNHVRPDVAEVQQLEVVVK